jgi:DNA mismatch endonuclease, patch repair protein
MTDVMTKEQRSKCMSNIKSKNTKPELILRKALWVKGMRYRIKNTLTGNPDLHFASKKLAIFIDGCFWHGCPDHYKEPKTRTEFWKKKIDGNIKRDIYVNDVLKDSGWKVLRFWEHEIKKNLDYVVETIISSLALSL